MARAGRISVDECRRADKLVRATTRRRYRSGVQTGWVRWCCPKSRMQMAIDEHHQHKDVYQHSLTVLRQAIALEDPLRKAPDLVLRWRRSCMTSVSRHPSARNGRRVSFHTMKWGARWSESGCGAEVLQTDDRRRLAAGVPPSAVPRLRRRKWTDSAVRRYVTDAGRCCPGCTSGACRLHDPQQAQGARLQASYDRLEQRSPSWPLKRIWRGAPRPGRNRIMQLLEYRRAASREAWRY